MARELHKTVEELLGSMSQTELIYWMAYFNIESEDSDPTKPKKRKKDERGYDIIPEDEQQVYDNAMIEHFKKLAEENGGTIMYSG